MAATAHADVDVAKKLTPVYLPDGLYNRVRMTLLAAMVGGWALSLLGYFLTPGHLGDVHHGGHVEPNRFFSSYLFAYSAFTMVPLAAWFFVQVQYLTGSAWSVTIRRIMETMMRMAPLAAVLFLPVAFGAMQGNLSIYEWARAAKYQHLELPPDKAGYLSPNFFFIRMAVYFALWTLFTWKIYSNSVAQDTTGDEKYMNSNTNWGAPGMFVAIISVTLFAFDLNMSLNPHWYSTIYGLYNYAGGAWTMFAILVLVCIGLQRAGVLKNEITTEHYHDLGKWMFALTVFWTYIAFSQYMLIWYANIPEETIYFRIRRTGTWDFVSVVLLLICHFIVPFVFLIRRAHKRNKTTLALAAFWFIAIQLVDHYWMIMPNFYPSGVNFHWLDITCVAAVAATYGFAFWTQLKQNSILCVGDPRFEQGLHFYNI